MFQALQGGQGGSGSSSAGRFKLNKIIMSPSLQRGEYLSGEGH